MNKGEFVRQLLDDINVLAEGKAIIDVESQMAQFREEGLRLDSEYLREEVIGGILQAVKECVSKTKVVKLTILEEALSPKEVAEALFSLVAWKRQHDPASDEPGSLVKTTGEVLNCFLNYFLPDMPDEDVLASLSDDQEQEAIHVMGVLMQDASVRKAFAEVEAARPEVAREMIAALSCLDHVPDPDEAVRIIGRFHGKGAAGLFVPAARRVRPGNSRPD